MSRKRIQTAAVAAQIETETEDIEAIYYNVSTEEDFLSADDMMTSNFTITTTVYKYKIGK